jgi:hypothetical protein
MSREALYELRSLVGKALGPRERERPGLTLDERITLRGLRQACEVEESRRHGDVRNGGRDWRYRRPVPRDRETVLRALRVVGRAFDKEAEELSYGLGEPPRWRFVAARRVPVARPRSSRRRPTRRVRGSSAASRDGPGESDPELNPPGSTGLVGVGVAA